MMSSYYSSPIPYLKPCIEKKVNLNKTKILCSYLISPIHCISL